LQYEIQEASYKRVVPGSSIGPGTEYSRLFHLPGPRNELIGDLYSKEFLNEILNALKEFRENKNMLK